ncbi:MAG: pyrroloquinoline quinone biosynthesis protein PqqB [Bosea sp.]|jgi:pyrroloquinoline quinone biosynthesis protein B|nr:pyrroloquinoline quinone biosynthesis protein PqqB [Bosea sp. (in: a-proteobacteria)]
MDASPAIRILGSAAGGGFPQWNCRCPVCQLAWAGDSRVKPRTQSSLALKGNDGTWVLVNASPDIRQQIMANPPLHPQGGLRHSPIAAVVLTNADVDHVAGLLGLRERWPLKVLATSHVLEALRRNPVFQVMADDVVKRIEVQPDQPFSPAPGIELELFSVPGKAPLWGEGETVETEIDDGRTVGVSIEAGSGRKALYIPGCAAMTEALRHRIKGATLVFFDGTLFTDDEMIRLGLGPKTGRRMGHMPVSGPGGTLEAFSTLEVRQKVFLHINNSNPMIVDGSPEHQQVTAAGWVVAEDGMEFTP